MRNNHKGSMSGDGKRSDGHRAPSYRAHPRLYHRDLASRIHVCNAAESGQTRTNANDPTVWSGRAVQEVSSTWLMRSCITVSGLSLERLLRAIMGISAHAT